MRVPGAANRKHLFGKQLLHVKTGPLAVSVQYSRLHLGAEAFAVVVGGDDAQ